MLIAVAGASSRLGITLLNKLSKAGYNTVALLRSGNSVENIPKNVFCRFVDYELEDCFQLKKDLSGVTHIVNITGSSLLHLGEQKLRLANVEPTKKLLESAPNSLERFIHISSICVYGKKLCAITDENCARVADNAYSKTKIEAENVVLSYSDKFKTIVLESAMIYGSNFSIGFYAILKKLLANKMQIIGDGNNHIPLIHSDDVCDAIIKSLDANVNSGSRFILSYNPPLTQKELLVLASKYLGVSPPTSHANYHIVKFAVYLVNTYKKLIGKHPSITIDMIEQLYRDRQFCTKKAKNELGFEPKVAFKTGIEHVVSEFREKNQR